MKKPKIKKKESVESEVKTLDKKEEGIMKGEDGSNGSKTKNKESLKKQTQKESAPKGMAALWANKNQWIGQIKDFFREVQIELKKVTWPSRKETIAATSMVIILSIVVAFFLGILDIGLAKAVGLFLKRS
jgi:preprotein translocase subunit SecE